MPAYADLNAHWAKGEVERLAQYGIGYDAALFQPRKAATQLDLVCLLASIRGYPLDPSTADAEQRNEAYAVAYEMGALTREQRRDDAVLTRGDAVKLVAQQRRIWLCRKAERHFHLFLCGPGLHPRRGSGVCGPGPGAWADPGCVQRGQGCHPGRSCRHAQPPDGGLIRTEA